MNRFSFSPAEHRLLNVIADPNAIKYTTRTAEANAALQNIAHQGAVQQNQQLIAQNPQGLAPGTPNTGTYNAATTRQWQMQNMPYVDAQGNPTAAGVLNQAQRTASIPGQTTYDKSTGIVTQGGQINAGAGQRLFDSGMTAGQAQAQVDANKPEIRQTMSNTGLPGATARMDAVNFPANGPGPAERAYTATLPPGAAPDPNIIAQARNQDKQAAILQQQQDQLNQDAAKKKAGDQAAASAGAASEGAKQPTPQDTGFDAALAALPPEYQALAPLFKGLVGSIQQGMKDTATLTQTLLDNNKTASDKIDERLNSAEAAQTAATTKIQGLLDNLKETQEKNLTDQQNAANQRLEWNRMQEEQRITVERRQARESKIAEMALKNRMGSDGALKELDAADQYYQTQWHNLQFEVGVQRTEIAAKYSGLFLEAENNYTVSSIQNIKDAQAALERIGTQKDANTRARNDAENGILKDMLSKQVDLRNTLAKTKVDIGDQISTFINQKRDDTRAQEQLGWQRLEWVATTYGSNAPQSLLDSIGKQLPGVDVGSVVGQMTLAELKKKGKGSGGGLSFSVSQKLPNGQPVTLDAFIAQKEKDWHATGQAGPASPNQRKAWEKEYNATKAQQDSLNPVTITRDLAKKAAYFPNVTSYNEAKTTINQMIAEGDYEGARKFTDGLGKPLSTAETKPYKAIGNVRNALNEMETLLTKIQDKVGPFPTEGPMWAWMSTHLESDPDYQRLQVLRGSTLAQYARGVSGETGVLTDPDVQRAAAGVIDPNVSAPAMRAAIAEAKKMADSAIQNNLAIDRAAGRAVSDVENVINSQNTSEDSGTSYNLTPEQRAFLYQ